MRHRGTLCAIGLAILVLTACSNKGTYYEREAAATRAKGDIVIALVDSYDEYNLFAEGAKTAIEEINSTGGVLGRKIRYVFYDDHADIQEARAIARTITRNVDVVAVVGHLYSEVAIPVAFTYDANGIVFISPSSTNPFLTELGLRFVFRNTPDDAKIGRRAAAFAVSSNLKTAAVLFQRNATSKRLAELFCESARDSGIAIQTVRSFFDWQKDFYPMLSTIKDTCRFDCIFLAGFPPTSAFVIKQARDVGITVPIITGDAMDNSLLIKIAGAAAEGTSVATMFNPNDARPQTQDFIKRFEAKYGFEPDSDAAQAYDSVKVLAHAWEKARSTVPIIAVSALRIVRDYQGVSSNYSFNRRGDVKGKLVYFKTVKDGKFVFANSQDGSKPFPDKNRQ